MGHLDPWHLVTRAPSRHQRGLPRPFDLGAVTNAIRGDGADVGAYEMVKCSGDVVNVDGTVGTPGPDVLRGGEGNDAIFGLGGNDTLIGGPGKDRLFGLKGEDRLNTKDGVQANDLANGGPRKDVCKTDPKDKRVSCR